MFNFIYINKFIASGLSYFHTVSEKIKLLFPTHRANKNDINSIVAVYSKNITIMATGAEAWSAERGAYNE